jgi:hypothetical protein
MAAAAATADDSYVNVSALTGCDDDDDDGDASDTHYRVFACLFSLRFLLLTVMSLRACCGSRLFWLIQQLTGKRDFPDCLQTKGSNSSNGR